MKLENKEVRLIMSKDRKYIAKGVNRNRYLIPVSELAKDKKRFLTYRSEASARAGYTGSGFYNNIPAENLEPVKAIMTISIE